MEAITAGEGAASKGSTSWWVRMRLDPAPDSASVLDRRGADRFILILLAFHFLLLCVLVFASLAMPMRTEPPFAWRALSKAEIQGIALFAIAATLLPPVVRRMAGSHQTWRFAATASLTTYSFLYIFATGGAIEAHFHLFIVVAAVAVWSDWRLGWIVLGLTGIHHVTLNAVHPRWLFTYGADSVSVVLHAAATLMAVAFTTSLCEINRRSLMRLEETRRALDLDVEARKRVEADRERVLRELDEERARLTAIVNEIPAGIVFAEAPSGRVLFANAHADEIIGRPVHRAENVERYDALRAFTPTGRPLGPEDWPLARAARHGETVRDVEVVIERADGGERRVLRIGAVPIRDDSGRPVAAVAVFEDVTAVHRATEALEEARRRALVNEKLSAMGHLVSGVAHEIRTPLTYMSNNLYLVQRRLEAALRDGDLAPIEPAQGHVRDALDGAARIHALVKELRRFMRTPLKSQGARLDDATSAAVELFRLTSTGRCRVEAHLVSGALLAVEESHVHQVVLNLLENAADAMPWGGTVRVETLTTESFAILVVEDEGTGIPKDVRDRVFEPFFTTKPQGSGFGLAILKRIVESHGGSVGVEDSSTAGARFLVRFPLAGEASQLVPVDAAEGSLDVPPPFR